MSKSRPRIKSLIETLFGYRMVIFVKYPSDWTAHDMATQLNWAKTHDVMSLDYNHFTLIKAIVKPRYVEHFRRDNDQYIVKHVMYKFEDEISFEVEDCLYD